MHIYTCVLFVYTHAGGGERRREEGREGVRRGREGRGEKRENAYVKTGGCKCY